MRLISRGTLSCLLILSRSGGAVFLADRLLRRAEVARRDLHAHLPISTSTWSESTVAPRSRRELNGRTWTDRLTHLRDRSGGAAPPPRPLLLVVLNGPLLDVAAKLRDLAAALLRHLRLAWLTLQVGDDPRACSSARCTMSALRKALLHRLSSARVQVLQAVRVVPLQPLQLSRSPRPGPPPR